MATSLKANFNLDKSFREYFNRDPAKFFKDCLLMVFLLLESILINKGAKSLN